MSWSPQQEQALKEVRAWLQDDDAQQVFRLFGFAGTGKTTLALELAKIAKAQEDGNRDKVLFGAFTGKASLVMRQKGCWNASTIHSMIYSLDEELSGVPKFVINKDSDVRRASLVIIDECSMVDAELGGDLLSFGTKVLVLGDPEQLPPVKGAGFFTEAKPDFMLTEVHRQARDNPIIRLSMDVREGRRLQFGEYGGGVRVVPRDRVRDLPILEADQVLVGMNRTRHAYNQRIRQMKEITETHPVEDERLVCLRNNRSKGLFNGGIFKVRRIEKVTDFKIELHVAPEDAGRSKKETEVELHPFFLQGREDELPWEVRREYDEFTYGYVLTVHKSQGSQWDNVFLFDESGAFRDDRSRWLYTGITRAAKELTVVLG